MLWERARVVNQNRNALKTCIKMWSNILLFIIKLRRRRPLIVHSCLSTRKICPDWKNKKRRQQWCSMEIFFRKTTISSIVYLARDFEWYVFIADEFRIIIAIRRGILNFVQYYLLAVFVRHDPIVPLETVDRYSVEPSQW